MQRSITRCGRRFLLGHAAIVAVLALVVAAPRAVAAPFTVNPQRVDPYKNFKFRVKWDGRYVAGVSRVPAGGRRRSRGKRLLRRM